MKTVLVSGVGAVIGYGIIFSLRQCPDQLNVIGMDIYEDAVGQHWCDDFVQAPLTSSPDYPNFLKQTLMEQKVDLFIPGIEQDVTHLAESGNFYADCTTRFALNNPNLIKICDDKWELHQQLVSFDIPRIPTAIDGEFDEISQQLGCPFLAKPRRSTACKGIGNIETPLDLSYFKAQLKNNFMAQQIVGTPDSEYTVATFGFGNGEATKPLTFKRTLNREGATTKAQIVHRKALDELTYKLVNYFKPVGPTNLQFREHQGEFFLLEINPRISSSTSIRANFGYNEADMCLEFYVNNKRPQPKTVDNGFIIRYLEDLVIENSDTL